MKWRIFTILLAGSGILPELRRLGMFFMLSLHAVSTGSAEEVLMEIITAL